MFHQYPITDELIDIQHRTFWSGAWECLLMLKEDGRNKSNCSWEFWLIGIERESGHWEWPEIAHQLGKVHHLSLRKHKPPNFQCYSVSSDIAERCKCSHLCSGIACVPMTTWSCNLFTEFPGSQCCIILSRTLPYSVSQNSLHYFSGLCTMDSALSSYRWVAETRGVKICHMVGKNQTRDIKSLVSCEVSGLSSTNMSNPVMGTGVCHLDSMHCSYLTADAFPFMPSDYGPANQTCLLFQYLTHTHTPATLGLYIVF